MNLSLTIFVTFLPIEAKNFSDWRQGNHGAPQGSSRR